MPTYNIDPGYTYSSNSSSNSAYDIKSSIAAPTYDLSNRVTLSSTLTSLSASSCQSITVMNNTGAYLSASINSANVIYVPTGAGFLFNVSNANQISVAGTGSIGYILSV